MDGHFINLGLEISQSSVKYNNEWKHPQCINTFNIKPLETSSVPKYLNNLITDSSLDLLDFDTELL